MQAPSGRRFAPHQGYLEREFLNRNGGTNEQWRKGLLLSPSQSVSRWLDIGLGVVLLGALALWILA